MISSECNFVLISSSIFFKDKQNCNEKVKKDEILKACALFVICTRVTTLYSYYLRMHTFSANQTGVIFFQVHYSHTHISNIFYTFLMVPTVRIHLTFTSLFSR